MEVIKDQKIVFTWGGVEGLEPGQSIVEITLEPAGDGTLLRLRHFGLPDSAIDAHQRGWELSGLPKIKNTVRVARRVAFACKTWRAKATGGASAQTCASAVRAKAVP